MIEASGIQVTSFIRGVVEEVVEAFFLGKLDDRQFLMPVAVPVLTRSSGGDACGAALKTGGV